MKNGIRRLRGQLERSDEPYDMRNSIVLSRTGCSTMANCEFLASEERTQRGGIAVKCKRNTLKRYCCLFNCKASRASHLEIAYHLTAASFLLALHHFVAVRGMSTKIIYWDNATIFVGAVM